VLLDLDEFWRSPRYLYLLLYARIACPIPCRFANSESALSCHFARCRGSQPRQLCKAVTIARKAIDDLNDFSVQWERRQFGLDCLKQYSDVISSVEGPFLRVELSRFLDGG
jgi:hypothetical protein